MSLNRELNEAGEHKVTPEELIKRHRSMEVKQLELKKKKKASQLSWFELDRITRIIWAEKCWSWNIPLSASQPAEGATAADGINESFHLFGGKKNPVTPHLTVQLEEK